jgi:hypothetical protein
MNVTPNTNLSEWCVEWINEILNRDEEESMHLEFKADINSKDPKHLYNIQKAVSSFANTFGGFIVFGIKDKASASGWERLCGVQNTTGFAKELTNKLFNGKLIPHIFYEGPNIIQIHCNNTERSVAIIKISSSELKPHAIVSESGLLEFWMRGNSTATAIPYPHLTSLIAESSELRNLLAALYLDTEYVDSFADKMCIPVYSRETSIPIVRINALVNSEQSSQLISKIPTDIALIRLIWQLRELIDSINCYRDMMIARLAVPITNAKQQNKRDNDAIESNIPSLKAITSKIRSHLLEKYVGVRDWRNVVQQGQQ